MMPEEPEEQPAPPGQVAINVSPQGMAISITPQPITLTINEEGMNQMVAQWLAAHPALFDELIRQRVTQKKTELAIITDIRSKR